MRFLNSLIAGAVLSVTAVAARADTIYTYNINGSGNFSLNGSVSGTITIDTTTGTVQTVTFTANPISGGAPMDSSMTFTGVDSQVPAGDGPKIYVGGDKSTTPDSTEALLSLDGGSLVAYNTSSDNAFDLRLPNGDDYVGHLTNGTLMTNPPPSPTPEPSSIALLGTGLLGVAGILRKRIG